MTTKQTSMRLVPSAAGEDRRVAGLRRAPRLKKAWKNVENALFFADGVRRDPISHSAQTRA